VGGTTCLTAEGGNCRKGKKRREKNSLLISKWTRVLSTLFVTIFITLLKNYKMGDLQNVNKVASPLLLFFKVPIRIFYKNA
jgi:hypothetical protein